MKRTLKIAMAAVLGAMLTLIMVGCGGTQAASSSLQPSSSNGSSAAESSSTSTSATTNGVDFGNVVVVYFSATGGTASVAEKIAAATDAGTFQLTPVEEYTSADLSYGDDNSRVSREHADESLQVVELESTTVPDWGSYETVFIGYPIWWGEAAWPVDGFVSANDFTGKTVIPFCTSASSGIGNSASHLETLAGTGDWLKGERFPGNATAETVQSWLESL